jgi:hypothetical protein
VGAPAAPIEPAHDVGAPESNHDVAKPPPEPAVASLTEVAKKPPRSPDVAKPPDVIKKPRPVSTLSTAPTVDELIAKNKLSDAVALCSSSALDKNPASCTLAACRVHDLTKAQKWLQSVPPNKRSSVTSVCNPKAPTHDDCDRDPMACMH